MLKQINNYVFSSTNGTLTFTDFATIELENIKSIVNVTRSQVLFNPLNPELSGSVVNNVLTLDISTSGMSSDDDLAIMYETSDNFATNEAQEDILEAVDDLESVDYATSEKQDTGNDFLQSLDGKDFATETTLGSIEDNQTNGNQKVKLLDGSGNPLISLNGALDVHDAWSHTLIINKHFIQETATQTTFGVGGASQDSYSLTLSSVTGIAGGDALTIREGLIQESDIVRVVGAPVGNVITIDRPLENSYTQAGVVTKVLINIAVNGSVTKQIFKIKPPADRVWHIQMILFSAIDPTQPTLENFCGITALTKGLVLSQRDGTNRNNLVLRNTGDFYEYFGNDNVQIIQRAPAGNYSVNAMWHFKEHSGAIVKLVGATDDELQLIIQGHRED